MMTVSEGEVLGLRLAQNRCAKEGGRRSMFSWTEGTCDVQGATHRWKKNTRRWKKNTRRWNPLDNHGGLEEMLNRWDGKPLTKP